MKWQTHKSLGVTIADKLGLTGRIRNAFLEGLIAPDFYPEVSTMLFLSGSRIKIKKIIVPHHRPNPQKILAFVFQARKLWLEGSHKEAAYWLGWGLHFLQDAFISKKYHANIEKKLLYYEIPEDALLKALNDSFSVRTVINLVKFARPMENAEEILWAACYFSTFIARGVFMSAKPPKNLLERFYLAKRKFIKKLLFAGGLAVCGGVLLFLFPWLSSLPFLLAFLSAPFSSKFFDLRREINWFR